MAARTTRTTALFVSACLLTATAAAQTAPPELTRQQRALLQTLVTAVDEARSEPAPVDHTWLTHVLRASDGSHYVAFSVTPPAGALPDKPVVLYVRLATATGVAATTSRERSVVKEWLAGSRVDPRLLPRRGGIAIGDMPPMGAGAVGVRGTASVGSPDLQVIDLERQRSRQRREEEERRRKAELEGMAAANLDRLPFEDFEIGATSLSADGTRAIQRALTAGPGAYDLYVAWVDASVPPATAQPQVARRSLRLGPALATEFGLSSVIVADGIATRAAPLGPLEQRARPYTIGLTEIVPARDTVFTPAERLAVAFQIVNPTPTATGKPDVHVNLRIVRLVGAREEPVAVLSPLTYDASTLPPDFDARLKHPLIAALAAPLATIPRGQYRLVITAEDRVSATVVATGADFTVIGTPASLLAEAPPLAPRFQPDAALAPTVMATLMGWLSPSAASPPLARAIASARGGRFAELLVADAVPAAEEGVRAALTGIALLSLGDTGAAGQFERALQAGAAPAPVEFLMGAARALQRRDADAMAAWQRAAEAGLPRDLVAPLVAAAHLRLRDYPGATAAISGDLTGRDRAWLRVYTATRIAAGRHDEAIAAAEALLAQAPEDAEARWLLLHALYADLVRGNRDRRSRVGAEAQRYIDTKGAHSALAREWLAIASRP
jgi:hypothetical protein